MREHPGGLLLVEQLLVEQLQSHEQPEHGAAERFRQPRRVVRGPRHKGPIRPEPAVRDEEVQVRMAAVTVRHRREQRGVQPLRPDRQPLRVATGAEVPALAGEREQVFVRAGITADAGEAVLEHAAGEELVRSFIGPILVVGGLGTLGFFGLAVAYAVAGVVPVHVAVSALPELVP